MKKYVITIDLGDSRQFDFWMKHRDEVKVTDYVTECNSVGRIIRVTMVLKGFRSREIAETYEALFGIKEVTEEVKENKK